LISKLKEARYSVIRAYYLVSTYVVIK